VTCDKSGETTEARCRNTMTLFESTLILLAVAVVLLGAARRLGVPYPAMLALAGCCAAALPWAPRVDIEPRLALALFVAPAVLDAAFDMPPRELLRNWVPLTSLAVMLVLVTTVAVAWAGWGDCRIAASGGGRAGRNRGAAGCCGRRRGVEAVQAAAAGTRSAAG